MTNEMIQKYALQEIAIEEMLGIDISAEELEELYHEFGGFILPQLERIFLEKTGLDLWSVVWDWGE